MTRGEEIIKEAELCASANTQIIGDWGENTRLPRKQKKCQKIAISRFLPKGQTNVLHIPKNGSTFLFYWHKDKIMMKTAGRMTLILESPNKGGEK